MASASGLTEVKLSIPITSWFGNLRREEDDPFLADLDVHVGQVATFKAHKNILGSAVPYFVQMFQKEVKNEVRLPKDKISPEGFRAVLKMVYGEEIGLSDENVQEIHKAALFLGMNQVAESCFDFLKNALNADNVISVWQYSHIEFDGSHELLAACTDFIRANLGEVCLSKDFASLDVQKVVAILSMENICVSGENTILDAVLQWLKHDWGSRYQHADVTSKLVLWSNVNFSKLHELESVKFFRGKLSNSAHEKDAELEMLKNLIAPPAEDTAIGVARQYDNVDNDTSNLSLTFKEYMYCLSRDPSTLSFILQMFDTSRNSWDDLKEISWIPRMLNPRSFYVQGMFRFRETPHIFARHGRSFAIYRLEGRNSIWIYIETHRNDHLKGFCVSEEGWFAMVFYKNINNSRCGLNVLLFDMNTLSADEDDTLYIKHEILFEAPDDYDYRALVNIAIYRSKLHIMIVTELGLRGPFVYNLAESPAELQSWKQGEALVSTFISGLDRTSLSTCDHLLFVIEKPFNSIPKSTVIFCMDMSSEYPKWIRLPDMGGKCLDIKLISVGGFLWLVARISVEGHSTRMAHRLPLKDLFSESSAEVWTLDEQFFELGFRAKTFDRFWLA